MPELDFCKLEVCVIHPFLSTKADERYNDISGKLKFYNLKDKDVWSAENEIVTSKDPDMVVQLQFDNTQLNCELKVVDSTEDESDKFQFKVWNMPENVTFAVDDYLLFKWYWEADPDNYTCYHGVIKSVKSKRNSADLETTVKGIVVDQDILYATSIYQKYPKLTYYSDVKNFIERELNLEFVSMIPGFSQKTPLPEPILTRGKSVGVIMETVCSQLTRTVLKNANSRYPNDVAKWKFLNGQTILIYRESDLKSRNSNILNNHLMITVPEVSYNDVLEFTDNGDNNFTLQVFGLPTVVSGISIHVDATDAPAFVTFESAYYTVDEVEHNITMADGYIMKAYVRKNE